MKRFRHCVVPGCSRTVAREHHYLCPGCFHHWCRDGTPPWVSALIQMVRQEERGARARNAREVSLENIVSHA